MVFSSDVVSVHHNNYIFVDGGFQWDVSGHGFHREDLSYSATDAIDRHNKTVGINMDETIEITVTTHRPHRYSVALVNVPSYAYREYKTPYGFNVAICDKGLKAAFGFLPTKLYIKIVKA